MSELDAERIKTLRAMTPAQRLQAGMRLTEEFLESKRTALRAEHADWSDEQINAALRQWTLRGFSDLAENCCNH